MPIKSISQNVKVTQTADPTVLTADTDATGVDHAGFESVEHIVSIGESGDTLSGSVKIDLILEDSDDDSAYSAVTDNDKVSGGSVDSSGIFATIDAAAEDDAQYRIGYVGEKQYSRVSLDFTGTHTNGIPIGAVAIQSHARREPTSDS